MTTRIMTAALTVAAGALAVGASIYTADWLACSMNHGGTACREPRNMAAGAWAGLAVNALALVTNTRKENQ